MTPVGDPGGNDLYPALAFDHDRVSDPTAPTAYAFDFTEVAGAHDIGTVATASGAIATLGASGVDPGNGVADPAASRARQLAGDRHDVPGRRWRRRLGLRVGKAVHRQPATGQATAVGLLASPGTRAIGIAARPNLVHAGPSPPLKIDESHRLLLRQRTAPTRSAKRSSTTPSPGSPRPRPLPGSRRLGRLRAWAGIQIGTGGDPPGRQVRHRRAADDRLLRGRSGADAEALVVNPTHTVVTVHNDLPAESPTASIETPAAGGTYALEAVVHTTFHCEDGFRGPGIARLHRLQRRNRRSRAARHRRSRPHTYTVKALSEDTKSAETSIEYAVQAPPAEPDVSEPPSPGRSTTPLLRGTARRGRRSSSTRTKKCSGRCWRRFPRELQRHRRPRPGG